MDLYSLKPYAFLIVSFALLLKPSTGAGGKALGLKPIEQERFVLQQRFGNVLHRFDVCLIGTCTPVAKELSSPGG